MHRTATQARCETGEGLSEAGDIFLSTVQRVLHDHCADWHKPQPIAWSRAAWSAIESIGVPQALIDEDGGGFGLATTEALRLVRLAGLEGAPLPIGEAMLATALLARAGIALAAGAITVALSGVFTLREESSTCHLRGQCARVPWGRAADWVVVLAQFGDETAVILTRAASLHWVTGENLAGEPRDTLQADMSVSRDCVGTIARMDALAQRSLGAALRCQALAGAIERTLTMTLQYAQDRRQFGRPIGRFQAIQHALATAAGHAAAADAAADMAAEAFASADWLPIAMAKSRCGESAGAVAAIAHQVHGALGFSAEYPLHHYTKRLWAWREEHGSESEWSERLGYAAFQAGPDGLWPLLTRT
jgi:alkylation response protein AidB-like acyl-CoA dehydrogenase